MNGISVFQLLAKRKALRDAFGEGEVVMAVANMHRAGKFLP